MAYGCETIGAVAAKRSRRTLPNLKKTAAKAAMLCLACVATFTATPSNAASTGVPFAQALTTPNGCFIFVRQNGAFGVNPDQTVLDSQLAGGAPAIADVFSYFPYDVTISPLNFFLPGPSGGSTGITTSASFSGAPTLPTYPGATWAELDDSQAASLPSGNSYTRVTVNMRVEKPTPFPAGSYTGHVIVTCQ